MIHVYVYAGLTIFMLGIFWVALTMPMAMIISESVIVYSGTATTVIKFMTLFIDCLPIFIGLGLIAWGFVKSVEERELGYTTI
jgi:hypothetical protein